MFSSHVKGSPLEGTAVVPAPGAAREKDLSRAERKAAKLAEERSAKALREAARQAEKADKIARKAAGKAAPKAPQGPQQDGKQKPPRKEKPRKAQARTDAANVGEAKAGDAKKRGVTIKLARHPQESRPKAPLQPAKLLKPKPSRRELAARQAEIDPFAPPPSRGIDLAMSSLVLGVVALALAWFPIAKWVGLAFAVLGIGFAAVDVRRDAAAGWLPGATTRWARTLGVAAIVVVLGSTMMAMKAGADAEKKASGHATGMVLSDDLGVKFGDFAENTDSIGVVHRGMVMTVKNKTGAIKSFDILVEAVNGNGERISSEQLLPRNMQPGQEIEYTIFSTVDDLTARALATADVKVASASSH